MAGFKDIVGHEQMIAHLSKALKEKQVSHAYLFTGEDGSGKRLLAEKFAQALVCEAGYGDACGICSACLQSQAGTHPDIRIVRHEKPATIGVDDVREQVVGDMQIRPYSSRYKVYIIDEAHKLTPQAQNALLKTIEEPPSYGVILLLTSSPESLLPTIRSRCVSLHVKGLPQEQIVQYLIAQYQIPDYKARVCAAYAQGSMGKAISMAVSEDYAQLQNFSLRLAKTVDRMDIVQIMDTVKQLGEYKDSIRELIDMLLVWYRDVMMWKLTRDPNLLIYPDEYSAISRQASQFSYHGLDGVIASLEKAKVRLAANVSFDTAMEMMLLAMKDKEN